MNEKLREIANRHLTIFYDEDSQMEVFRDDALVVLQELMIDIIKECISVYETDPSIYHEVNVSNIKQHFGVE